MAKRWHIRSHDPASIAALQRTAGVPDVVAQLLICRGITDPAKARSFLDPKLTDLYDPETLPGCREAAQRIHAAVEARERIVIYGDYDVDGMSGTAILYLCLKLLGAEVSYYVPHRVDEGYGLNCEAVQSWGGGRAALMITVDCGISGVEEAAVARAVRAGLDHHRSPYDRPATARSGGHRPSAIGRRLSLQRAERLGRGLQAGLGVCQQASGAQKVSPRMRDFLVQAVGLAALGTVADVVPLVDENRVLVHHGLESLARCPTLGMATLMKIAKVEPKTNGDGKPRLDSEDIGFALAPRLNAAGRLAQAQLGVELLVTDRADRALELAAIHRPAQRQPPDAGTKHADRREEADRRAVRRGRRSRRSCSPSGAGTPA